MEKPSEKKSKGSGKGSNQAQNGGSFIIKVRPEKKGRKTKK